MVGHYLMTLCPEAEHDVLTGKMAPGTYGTRTERCLVGWASDQCDDHDGPTRPRHDETEWGAATCVEVCYDDLCDRFGTQRVNQAIRNRILSNIARRELAVVGLGV